MRAGAGMLAVLAAALAGPVPRLLARARWPQRAPGPALLLWQATGLAAGLAAIGAPLLLGLAPLGSTLPDALLSPRGRVGPVEVVALVTAAGVAGRLLGVLVVSTCRTLRSRRRHRLLVDLVTTPSLSHRDVHVLQASVPVAYCLPGLRPRVVVSAGALSTLDEAELAAVLAHERAHAGQRHDLVVLPFVALAATFGRLRAVRCAQESVALLIELLADDTARRTHDPAALARALNHVAVDGAPDASAVAVGRTTAARTARLLRPALPVPAAARAAVYAAALALACVPTALLVVLPAAAALLNPPT